MESVCAVRVSCLLNIKTNLDGVCLWWNINLLLHQQSVLCIYICGWFWFFERRQALSLQFFNETVTPSLGHRTEHPSKAQRWLWHGWSHFYYCTIPYIRSLFTFGRSNCSKLWYQVPTQLIEPFVLLRRQPSVSNSQLRQWQKHPFFNVFAHITNVVWSAKLCFNFPCTT